MAAQDEKKGMAKAAVFALIGATLAVASAAVLIHFKANWGIAALICAVLAGLLMEGFSVAVTSAGYLSLAVPLYFLVMFNQSINGNLSFPGTGLAFGVALAGVAGLARLIVPFPEKSSHTVSSRLAGYGLNIVKVALAGGAAVGAVKTPLGVLVGAVAAAGVWLFLDQVLVPWVFGSTEDDDTVALWDKVPLVGRSIFCLMPVVGVIAGWVRSDVQADVLSVVGVALVGFAFRAAAKYYIDEIVVQDQHELVLGLNQAKHRERVLKDQLTNLQSENKQFREELTSVYTMAESLGASTRVEDSVEVVGYMIKTLRIPFQSCVILLDKNGTLTPVLSQTRYQSVLNMSHLLQLEETVIKEVFQSGKAQLVPHVKASPEGRIFKDERSVMCVPLPVSKEIVGVIYVGSANPNTHNDEHLKHLKMIASLAAPSIKSAMLFQEKDDNLRVEQTIRAGVEAKNAQLAELQSMGQRMGATLKTANTIRVVSESLKKMTRAQSVILFTRDTENPDLHALKAEYADTPYDGYVNNLALRDDEGLLGKAINLKTTLLVRDTEMSDLHHLLSSERSVAVAPLLISASDGDSGDKSSSAQEFLGCLYVGAAEKNALTEDHRNLIETVSYQTAMALKNARLYEQTQRQALTDGLTGLYTHRLFQEKLSEEIELAKQTKQELVLVMVDCDNFKTFNDTLGHPAGDALLKDVASLLKDKVRTSDIVARYGGDEFALLLKHTRKEDALRMCERIREAFQLRFGGNSVQVTSSIGLACFPTDAVTKTDLAKAADDALYVSKRGGRNQVAASKTLQERTTKPLVEEVLVRIR